MNLSPEATDKGKISRVEMLDICPQIRNIEPEDNIFRFLEPLGRKCMKCGGGHAVYPVPYIKDSEFWVCNVCDKKLFDILDKTWKGVPETGYDDHTIDGFYARLIVLAFFS